MMVPIKLYVHFDTGLLTLTFCRTKEEGKSNRYCVSIFAMSLIGFDKVWYVCDFKLTELIDMVCIYSCQVNV